MPEMKVQFEVQETMAGNAKVFEVIGTYTGQDGKPREWFVTSFTQEDKFDTNAESRAITVAEALAKAYEVGYSDGNLAGLKEGREFAKEFMP